MENKVDGFIKDYKRSLFILATPLLTALIVQTMYNIVDTAFVGRLGTDAIAALTFSFPLFFFLVAINSGLGIGTGSRISRLLGAKRKEDAENTAMHGLIASLLLALFLFTTCWVLQDRLFILFGASGNVLKLANSYMLIILFGVFVMFPGYVLNSIFSAQGDTKTPMKVQITGLVLNIILDPIFIYTFGYGVKGAAIATVIALTISLVMGAYYIRKKSYLHIRLSSFKYSYEALKDIIKVGIPASFMMLIISVYIVFLNNVMSSFGTEYVAAFGISWRLESLITLPMVAFSMSSVTLVGMFCGAKRFDLVRKTVSYSLKICIGIALAIGSLFFAAPSLFFRIFTSDASILSIASAYMKINVFTFPLLAINMTACRVTQGLGHGMPAFVIQFIRVFVVAVPLAYAFVFLFGYGFLSVAVAMVIGSLVASIVSLIWLKSKLRSVEKMCKEF